MPLKHKIANIVVISSICMAMFGSVIGNSYAGTVDLSNFGEISGHSNHNDFGLNKKGDLNLKTSFANSTSFANPMLVGAAPGSTKQIESRPIKLRLIQGDFKPVNEDKKFYLGLPSISLLDASILGIDYFTYTGKGQRSNLFGTDKHSIQITPAFLWAQKINPPSSNTVMTAEMIAPQFSQNGNDKKLAINVSPSIPEPSPLILAALGIFGAVIASYRKKTLS